MNDKTTRHVAVIGGGIIGACCALALVRAGQRVTLIEPETPGGTQAASYGNGAFLSPASIIPMSVPGLWKKVPGYLTDPTGPLTIRWRYLPRLLPWLARFLYAGHSLKKVRRTASILWSLVHDSPDRHAELAASCARPEMVRRDGLLYAYPDRAAFEQEALSWSLRRENGLTWREIAGEELREIEPALAPSYSFAVLVESGASCTDPGAYVAAVVAQAVAEGAELVRTKADGFHIVDGKLAGVRTTMGTLACDHAVVAAGIRSKALAGALGDTIPLESERGYHVEIASPDIALRRPVMPSDGKMSNVMTPGGLRAAGQVELASVDAEPDWRRANILMDHLRRTYPQLATKNATARWIGHRPSTPDGLPVIGKAKGCGEVVYAFGHGHIGLSAAPRTAEIVTSLICDTLAPIDTSAFAASRFR